MAHMTIPPLPLRPVRRAISLLLALAVAACKGDAPVPSSVVAVTTQTTAAPVASRLSEANAPAVKITDAKGKPMRNLLVRWKVTSGGGSVLNDSVRTDAQGQASSGGWNLGTTAGIQTLTATLDGLAPVTFTATAVPGPIAELTPLTTTFTNTVVNQAVVPSPAVLAKDAYGNLVPGGQVVFVLAQSQGAIVGETQATNAQGIATLPSWQLGTTAGAQSLRATTPTAQAITITVTARPGPVTRLVAASQPDVAGVIATAVGAIPSVRTTDAFNNGVPNIPVTWTLGANSGSITTPNAVSDANGVATPGAWVLGSAPTQTLTATSSAVPGTTLAFTARPVSTQYDIGLQFIGSGGTEVMRDAFRAAATRWRSVITGDVQTSRLTAPSGSCASWQPAVDSTINDVLIWARIAPIDGVGNILARAGPCYINPGTRLTVAGIMEFDEADLPALINNGGIVDVITHEMGHVLGIGTLWNFGGRTLLVGSGGADPYFQGTAGRAGFTAINTVQYSGNPVPVENTGGSGTRDSHWRESTFGRELMTGFYNSGVLNPLSRVTIGSLEDLGYQVNYNAAEPYSITALLYTFPFTPSANSIPIVEDLTSIPLYELRNGRGVLIRAAR
jgi:hypothetical protein